MYDRIRRTCLEDFDPQAHPELNKYQLAHKADTFNVWSPIEQEGDAKSLPPLATQWRNDYKRRFCNDISSRRD